MNNPNYIFQPAFRAVASVAYRLNEVFAVYPITPTSEMSELVESWSSQGQKNIYGQIPAVVQMQSEAGAAGALHGALQTGSLAASFTASQGLLLMLPNMYKIAGELTPGVLHVATRSIATHALSVFPDHSDVMAVRQSGYAMLASASPQEAQDFAAIAQAASLKSRIPFLHFFDGFRTSHEYTSIRPLSDSLLRRLIPEKLTAEHRQRALNPDRPVVRGTAQGPDIFFEQREASSPYYEVCPGIVQETMDQFATWTGRKYRLFEYSGHPNAEIVVIAMASSCETIENVVADRYAGGDRVGLLKVRLFRPFSIRHFTTALPARCKQIAVLDRCKEPGSSGEPLYLDVASALSRSGSKEQAQIRVTGCRYGLGGRDLTPAMVHSLLDDLQSDRPVSGYALGLREANEKQSLPAKTAPLKQNFPAEWVLDLAKKQTTAEAYQSFCDQLAGGSGYFVQRYDVPGYDKAAPRILSHLRLSESPVRAPYKIQSPGLVLSDRTDFPKTAIPGSGGALLLFSNRSDRAIRGALGVSRLRRILENGARIWVTGASPEVVFGWIESRVNDNMRAGGWEGMLQGLGDLHVLEEECERQGESPVYEFPGIPELPPVNGSLTVDGTFLGGSAHRQPPVTGNWIPEWSPEACTQCGLCSLACPSGALRAKLRPFPQAHMENTTLPAAPAAPDLFGKTPMEYLIGINPEGCTSCGLCVSACESDALQPVPAEGPTVMDNWKEFREIQGYQPALADAQAVAGLQFREPLFRNPRGVQGCAQSQYLKAISQLYGDRLLIANATGSSSIFGGNAEALPWYRDAEGRGPAWSNSLFEDNAEFGLGFRLSLDQQQRRARALLDHLSGLLPADLVETLDTAKYQGDSEILSLRKAIERLKVLLHAIDLPEARTLSALADNLVSKSVWIVGGDGWAYDIGFGGLDHVLASGANVNILVLDNEVYSNTGGQASKATPAGAIAGLASSGRVRPKKDLGAIAMHYDDVYVASIALLADPEQAILAIREAEQHPGPSLILAYCHSPAHGVEAEQAVLHQKLAVASGQWLLYRRKALPGMRCPSLTLDSQRPSVPVAEYMAAEARFGGLSDPEGPEIAAIQKFVDNRFRSYSDRARRKTGRLRPQEVISR